MKILNFKRRNSEKGTPLVVPVIAEDEEKSGYYYFDAPGRVYTRIKKVHEGKKFEITNKMNRKEREDFIFAREQDRLKRLEENTLDWK